VPPAKPSSPSARLIALVTPTRKKRVSGSEIQSGSGTRSSSVMVWICTSPRTIDDADRQHLTDQA
jgi:hypothetical protein